MIWGLLRHCKAIRLFPEEILGRHKDPSLTGDGFDHANRVGREIKTMTSRPERILSSPRFRCLNTALGVSAELGVAYESADWLDERDYGGVLAEEFIYPEGLSWEDKLYNHRPGGTGETLEEVIERVRTGMAETDLDGVLVISHEIVLKAVLYHLGKLPFKRFYDQPWPEGHLVRHREPEIEGVAI